MSERYEKLLDRMVQLFGPEHQYTIEFARLLEEYPDSPLNWNYTVALATVEFYEQMSPICD